MLFSVASLLNGFAQSSAMLIVGRGLQGLGGALVSPAALSIITTTFTDQDERTKALGVWSAIAAGGGAVGLLMGGVLTDLASWRWVFFVNVPVGIITIALALRYVAESRVRIAQRSFDLAGAVTVTSGLVVLVYAIVKAQAFGWGSARTIGLGAVAFALLAAFLVIERRCGGAAGAAQHLPRAHDRGVATRCCCWPPRACSECSSSRRCTCRRSSATAR